MGVALDVIGFGHRYRAGKDGSAAVIDVSFGARPAELVCLVGPSGCGKSTLLRAVAGLIAPTRGVLYIAGEPFTGVPAGLAMVFQDHSRSLYPWLSARGNVELPLRATTSRAQRRYRDRARDALHQVGLDGQGGRYPRQLSGGMQQRVAIPRALAYRPSLMLLDEPFASVDAQTPADLEDLVLAVRDRHGMTVLVVTHDIDDAVYLADRVVVLSPAPATVVTVLDVNLPRPREQITTRESPAFVEVRARAARLMRQPGRPRPDGSAHIADEARSTLRRAPRRAEDDVPHRVAAKPDPAGIYSWRPAKGQVYGSESGHYSAGREETFRSPPRTGDRTDSVVLVEPYGRVERQGPSTWPEPPTRRVTSS